MSRGAPARAAAARAVAAVVAGGRSLTEALPAELAGLDAVRDRALAQAMAYGALRRYYRTEPMLAALLQRPLKRGEDRLRALLHVGLFQIDAMNVPDHAAVAATVDACTLIGRRPARGLVNAVLRRFLREREAMVALADETESGRYGYPDWLIRRLRADWPGDWQGILAAGDEPPPMWLRVNRRRTEPEAWRARLEDNTATASDWIPEALRLERPVDVFALPGFADGDVSVQDAGAQLAARLVDPRAGERILDACAAPGGKTAHLLELAPAAEVLALDAAAERLTRVDETLERLGLRARTVCADAGEPKSWWDGRPFDAILLDAPCTASGVIRRHPDIKLLRRDSDVSGLAKQQARLLDALWPLLAPGGRLVYVTCSVFLEEGDRQVAAFAERHPHAHIRPPESIGDWGRALSAGRQILPGATGMDGFYYACLVNRL